MGHVAACCSLLQCAAVCCSGIPKRIKFDGICCSVLQSVVVCCSVLQCVVVEYIKESSWMGYIEVCCGVLQCVAVCCSVFVLQCVAVCFFDALCHACMYFIATCITGLKQPGVLAHSCLKSQLIGVCITTHSCVGHDMTCDNAILRPKLPDLNSTLNPKI